MTNEEAREQLKHMKIFIGYDAENPIVKEMQSALDLAIKALEQQSSYNSVKTELEPCDDCISREDALNVAIDAVDEWDGGCNTSRATMISNAIKELPPVKPEQKIDEIIKRIEETRDKDKLCEYPYNRCIDIVREVLG